MYEKDEPSALFHSLHQTHRKRVMEEQSARGLGDLGAPMLLMVVLRGESRGVEYSQREVAQAMHLSPATVAVSLKSLERLGYVERHTDRRDARRNLIATTVKGRRAVEACGELFRAVDEKMLAGFSPDERRQLTGFFQRMLANLGGPADFMAPPPDL